VSNIEYSNVRLSIKSVDSPWQDALVTLTQLLHKRFGELPDWAQQRIEEADETQLERWADEVLDAHSLDILLGSH
jgi:hypothetical protein